MGGLPAWEEPPCAVHEPPLVVTMRKPNATRAPSSMYEGKVCRDCGKAPAVARDCCKRCYNRRIYRGTLCAR